jgi:predicted ATPase
MVTKSQGAPEVERAYARARELCQQVEDAPQLCPVLFGLWYFYLVRAEFQTARELGEQLLTVAQRVQDPTLLLLAHRVLGQTLASLGELPPAQAHLEQGIALYDPQRHHSLALQYGQDPGVICRSWAALALRLLGYPDQALESISEALTLARELVHPYSLAYALMWAAVVHQFRRERRAAQERAEELLALAREQGFAHWLAAGTIWQGWGLSEQGQGTEGIAQIHQGVAGWRACGVELWRPYFLALLAEAYGNGGQAEEGLHVLGEALAAVEKTGERFYEAELYGLKGELLLRRVVPDEQQAETSFYQALDIARSQQAKSLELRAALRLSRLWQQQGKCAAAYELLAEVYNWFTEGFDTADLQEAKALLEELE